MTEQAMSGPVVACNYADMVRAAASDRPDATAIQIGAARATYAELVAAATARARELKALGLRPGDRLGTLLPNSITLVELMIAASMLGVVSGRLRFHGRFKDQLEVGGENVSALEVESFLCSHPAVKQARVIGTPDPRLGEVPVAFVEPMAGRSLTAEALIAYCEGRIARFKVPRPVRFVTEWPMSATKIMKNRLRERFTEELAERRRAS